MAATIMTESLDLGKALVDEKYACHIQTLSRQQALTRARHLPGQHHEVQDGNYTDTTLVAMITLEGRESVAEVQVDEDIILAIADLDVPLVMGGRPNKLIKATRETAMVSWDRKRKGSVEDEVVPLPSERVKNL